MVMNNFTKKINSKIAGLVIIVILFGFLSPIFVKKADAFLGFGDIVIDPTNLVQNTVTAVSTGATAISTGVSAVAQTALVTKEFGLDAIAYKMLDLVIQRISASTVNWINSGFHGSPAFITNPEGYFLDLGDKIAGQYIFKNPNLNFLCGPISARIKIALSTTYTGAERRWQCTLTDVAGNMEDFMNDFERGGWNKFFRLTQESQNNPIGAYIQAEGELFQKIAQKTEEKNKELSWGKGFLSFKTCPPGKSVADQGESDGDDVLNPNACTVDMITNTPGSVISEQLNKTLGISGQKLAVADEINEIISALLNQLVGQIIGGIGKGLRGLSSPSPANNNRIFTNELSVPENENITNTYFRQSEENVNRVINTPPYVPPTLPPPPSSGICDPYDTVCIICTNNPTSPECLSQTTP